jgi:tryptophan-rich sensory protein
LEGTGIDIMTWMDGYNSLAKPDWTHAPATIGLIWQILYPIIIVTFGFMFVQTIRGKVGWTVALPFAINLVANLLFMPIFPGLRRVPLAAADILIVWATIIWCVVAVWPQYRLVAIVQGPYFIWMSIATVRQLSITWGNWER